MRVCLVISDVGPGGAQRVLTALAAEWVAKGHDVHLLLLHGDAGEVFYPVDPSVDVQFLRLSSGDSVGAAKLFGNLQRIRMLRRAIRRLQPDVVISFIDQCNVLSLLASIGLGVPVVVSERTDPRNSPSGRVWHLLCRMTYPLARSLVVQTAEIAALYAASSIRSVATIPNPVYPPRAAERSALPSPYVMAAGRISPEKGFDVLLEAFAEIAPQFTGWTLVIAGDGPERRQLEEQSRRLGIGNRCIFLGAVKNVTAVMRDADLFVLPSRLEGFPNALCEAMACGIACIATDCPSGPRNIIRKDVDGVLVPAERPKHLAQAMRDLMESPMKRRRLGEHAKEIVDRFSAGRVLALWDDVLSNARAGRAR